MHNKRGALELPINVLVTIIIALVILASGITLLYKFIGGAEELKGDIDERTNAELERLLVDQGKQVALPLHTATIERGSTHVFGIGILNIGSERQFQLQIELSKVVDRQEQDITTSVDTAPVEEWLLYEQELIPLAENEHRKEPILVNVPANALSAQYIFNANVVLEDGEQYGNTQKFIVTVE
ncbi:MAG TPA: hypothetical protein VJI32_02125 [Candidatus Nanoarchaeia archaeon]|nr:hypothetical protein [Candidatus Nanoarchaeia archaeon]